MSARVIPLCSLLPIVACAGNDTGNTDTPPAVEIVAPGDGVSIASGTVELVLEVANVTLRPAGTEEPNTGHHHLFINREIVAEGAVIPAEEGIVHLGAAQTFHTFENLEPGEYTVIAVLGDHMHARVPSARTDTVRFTITGL